MKQRFGFSLYVLSDILWYILCTFQDTIILFLFAIHFFKLYLYYLVTEDCEMLS